MATTVIPSSISPTGYVDSNGNFVTSTGTPYTASSGALSTIDTSSTPTNLTSGAFNQIGGTSSGLTTLSPNETTAKTIALQGTPSITESANQVAADPYNTQAVLQSNQEAAPVIKLADGGSTDTPTYNYNQTGFPRQSPLLHRPTQATQLYGTLGHTATDLAPRLIGVPGHADGGSIPEGHNPQFFSEGGLQHAYVKGDGDGTSDSVPAMLASGEFVIPADVVSSLGNGDNDAGAKIMDEFLRTIRKHKRAADAKDLPPDSKGPLAYLTEAEKKVK